jgi:hypothetical protein
MSATSTASSSTYIDGSYHCGLFQWGAEMSHDYGVTETGPINLQCEWTGSVTTEGAKSFGDVGTLKSSDCAVFNATRSLALAAVLTLALGFFCGLVGTCCASAGTLSCGAVMAALGSVCAVTSVGLFHRWLNAATMSPGEWKIDGALDTSFWLMVSAAGAGLAGSIIACASAPSFRVVARDSGGVVVVKTEKIEMADV